MVFLCVVWNVDCKCVEFNFCLLLLGICYEVKGKDNLDCLYFIEVCSYSVIVR